jgi:hypothetical protein
MNSEFIQWTAHKLWGNSHHTEVVHELRTTNTVKNCVWGNTPTKIHDDQNCLQNIWYAASNHTDMETTYQFQNLEQLSINTEQWITVKMSLYDTFFQTTTPFFFIVEDRHQHQTLYLLFSIYNNSVMPETVQHHLKPDKLHSFTNTLSNVPHYCPAYTYNKYSWRVAVYWSKE